MSREDICSLVFSNGPGNYHEQFMNQSTKFKLRPSNTCPLKFQYLPQSRLCLSKFIDPANFLRILLERHRSISKNDFLPLQRESISLSQFQVSNLQLQEKDTHSDIDLGKERFKTFAFHERSLHLARVYSFSRLPLTSKAFQIINPRCYLSILLPSFLKIYKSATLCR